MRWGWRIFILLTLTIVTQIGGLAYLASFAFRRRLAAFLLIYMAISGAAVFLAPMTGRVALPCFGDSVLKVQSGVYCALNRHYVTPDMHSVLVTISEQMNAAHPDTQTLVLDANFPFIDGFPLLPHLSHDDGKKADIAFYYNGPNGYRRGATRSPVGYFTFEDGPSECPKTWPTLRWDMGWLQSLRRDLTLDAARMKTVLELMSSQDLVGKVFIEPHLSRSLSVNHPKIRFQGCRAARHDDHIHLQL